MNNVIVGFKGGFVATDLATGVVEDLGWMNAAMLTLNNTLAAANFVEHFRNALYSINEIRRMVLIALQIVTSPAAICLGARECTKYEGEATGVYFGVPDSSIEEILEEQIDLSTYGVYAVRDPEKGIQGLMFGNVVPGRYGTKELKPICYMERTEGFDSIERIVPFEQMPEHFLSDLLARARTPVAASNN